MKKNTLILLAVFSSFNVSPGFSETTPITWEEAVRTAKANNPDLKAAAAAVESSEASFRASGSDYWPQISGGLDYSRSGAEVRTAAGTVRSAGNDYSGSLSLRQSLFSGFSTQASREIAKARFDSAKEDLELAEASLYQSLKTTFVNLLTSQENLILLRKIRDRRAENKRLIGLRFDAGRENRGSFMRASAQLAQADFEVARAERALRVTQRAFAQSLGKDAFEALAVTGTFVALGAETLPGGGSSTSSTGKFVATAPSDVPFSQLARATPEYQKQEYALQAAQSGVKSARSGFFPQLSASGSLRRRGSEFPLDTDSWSAGLSLSIPIFSGLSDYYSTLQAKADLRRSLSLLESTRRNLERSLESAWASWQDAGSFSDVQLLFLNASEERAKIARAQYTTGLVSFQDWDIIESDLINAQKQYLSALRDAVTAEADWRRAQGKGF